VIGGRFVRQLTTAAMTMTAFLFILFFSVALNKAMQAGVIVFQKEKIEEWLGMGMSMSIKGTTALVTAQTGRQVDHAVYSAFFFFFFFYSGQG
jgi:hypothetical protein